MSIKDGGPAFPFGQVSEHTGKPINGYHNDGMSLRDYFASNVTYAEVEVYAPSTGAACNKFLGLDEKATWDGTRYMEIVAIIKYRIADTMLAAREAKQ